MKKIYTAFVVLGLALGANAQTPIYKLDSTFSADGIASFGIAGNVEASGNAVLPAQTSPFGVWVAGRVITAGNASTSFYIARLLSNGNLDTGFGSNGNYGYSVNANVSSSVIDLHRIYGGAYASHSGYGGLYAPSATAAVVDNQIYNLGDNYVIASSKLNDSLIVQLSSNNELLCYKANSGNVYAGNPWFDGGNYYGNMPTTVDGLSSVVNQKVAVQSDGKILVAGYAGSGGSHLFIQRFKKNSFSVLDSTFGVNGVVKYTRGGSQFFVRDISCLQVYPGGDDRIVLGYGNYIYRFSANGTLDNSFIVQIPDNFEQFTRLAFDAYNNIVAIGKTNIASTLYAFKSDGSPLTTFHKGKNTYTKTDADINLSTMDLMDVKIDGGSNIYVSGSMKESSASDPQVLVMKFVVSLCTDPSVAIDEKATSADFVIFNAERPTSIRVSDSEGGSLQLDTIKTGTGTASITISGLLPNKEYYYTVTNSNGCTSTGTFTTLDADPTSLQDLISDKKVVLFPNPAKSNLNISSETIIDGVEISNVLGEVVKVENLSNNTVDISELKPGVYFVQLKHTKDVVATKKFIKE